MLRESSFMSELEPIDEEELQRKELERLLTTAENEERRQILERSIKALESPKSPRDSTSSSPTSPKAASGHTQNNPNALPRGSSWKFPFEMGPKSRPVSAQRRRPSNANLLGIIPENFTINQQAGPREKGVEVELLREDIADVLASSYDPSYPPENMFLSSSRPPPQNKFWISTGMLPQILAIQFSVPWHLRKIEITCVGVEEITVQIEYKSPSGAGSSSSSKGDKPRNISAPVVRVEDRLFVFDWLPYKNGNAYGLPASKVSLVFTKSNQLFFTVLDLKIKAVPIH